jgi:hypothetical protein
MTDFQEKNSNHDPLNEGTVIPQGTQSGRRHGRSPPSSPEQACGHRCRISAGRLSTCCLLPGLVLRPHKPFNGGRPLFGRHRGGVRRKPAMPRGRRPMWDEVLPLWEWLPVFVAKITLAEEGGQPLFHRGRMPLPHEKNDFFVLHKKIGSHELVMTRCAILWGLKSCSCGSGFQPRLSRLESRFHGVAK